MKKLLLLLPAGLLLFAATVIGLLAAQGRLNHAGTRGIPILEGFFPPPADGEPAAAGAPAATGGTDHRAAGGDAHPAPAGPEPRGVQADGLGKEKPLPYRRGESLFQTESDGAGGQGADAGGGHAAAAGDHDAAAPAGGGDGHSAAPAGAVAAGADHGAGQDGDPGGARSQPSAPAEWRAKVDSVLGQGQYRPGRFWSFPQVEAGMTVDELNAILTRARTERAAAERERTALERQRAELVARERDVADRQDAVMEKMREVEQLRAKLQAEIDEFHHTVSLIRQDELAGLKSVAKSLAAIEPQSAASVIKKWWETEEGQAKALKIWTAMDVEAAHGILAELDVELIRQVLERRLKVVREPARGKER